ncbi:hypothetical protein ASPBRDRAFT_416130 [Aspergillus brasiliensis CBS 101740]|uniref:PPM-type phosphatase domain-containing protein n=1 Tax=Aspergillus brasiliensis (strain CBS 101740 / IMI 381727 / IBT 21946) TaxID=767769 RepID=A0A1L9UY82_ASPBC|nr:hypothetical protein ASPBRDRAFT_416130 [Aspergillus brasiliensis CBS 101740]
MFTSLGGARTRLTLRVPTTSPIRHQYFLRLPRNQNHARPSYTSYSTKGASTSSRNSVRNIVLAGAVGATGVWLFSTNTNTNTSDSISASASLDHDDKTSAVTDAPCLPHTLPIHQGSVETGLSEDEVTRIISSDAYSFPVRDVSGVSRYDGVQVASNEPCEDRFVHGKFTAPWGDTKEHWMAWGVFDGHLGGQMAEVLRERLLGYVRDRLGWLQSVSGGENTVGEEMVHRAIMDGFVSLDDSIVKDAMELPESEIPLPEKVKRLAPAYAGSCALLSLYDPASRMLHVACTGDSRAVLAQKGSDGKWEATPLSVDQTGHNEAEIARLQAEHPGEDDMIKGGRVLGLAVSRAFGDCQWKWPLEFQEDVQKRFYGPAPLTPRYDVRTPPYLTAKPVVTSTRIEDGKPAFLIMATDGLWDMMSSQQAVDLVGKWLEGAVAEKSGSLESNPRFDFSQFWDGTDWQFVEGRTAVQDENAAVHLVRNSLGGNHHEMIAGRLAFSFPASRRVRDDITVQVVFFNEEPPN